MSADTPTAAQAMYATLRQQLDELADRRAGRLGGDALLIEREAMICDVIMSALQHLEDSSGSERAWFAAYRCVDRVMGP